MFFHTLVVSSLCDGPQRPLSPDSHFPVRSLPTLCRALLCCATCRVNLHSSLWSRFACCVSPSWKNSDAMPGGLSSSRGERLARAGAEAAANTRGSSGQRLPQCKLRRPPAWAEGSQTVQPVRDPAPEPSGKACLDSWPSETT